MLISTVDTFFVGVVFILLGLLIICLSLFIVEVRRRRGEAVCESEIKSEVFFKAVSEVIKCKDTDFIFSHSYSSYILFREFSVRFGYIKLLLIEEDSALTNLKIENLFIKDRKAEFVIFSE